MRKNTREKLNKNKKFIFNCINISAFFYLLYVVDSAPLQSAFLNFQLQPCRFIPFKWYGIWIWHRSWAWLEWMHVFQFSHQKLFVDLLWVSVPVHIEVEGPSNREPLLFFNKWLREVVFKKGFLHFYK